MFTAFHGTNADFIKFDSSFLGLNTDDNATDESFAETAHLGFWFCDSCDIIRDVYDKLIVCSLDIKNPCEVSDISTLANWVACTGKRAPELVEYLKTQGYDGIKIEWDEEFEGTSFVAFDSSQITVKNMEINSFNT